MALFIQNCTDNEFVPGDEYFNKWVSLAVNAEKYGEITIKIVSVAEIIELNTAYRNKNSATNVLSFPFENDVLPVDVQILGDIAICSTIVNQEAQEQNKNNLFHWAHLVIHGVLHLLGYDHIEDSDALEMESLEIELLASLGIENPY